MDSLKGQDGGLSPEGTFLWVDRYMVFVRTQFFKEDANSTWNTHSQPDFSFFSMTFHDSVFALGFVDHEQLLLMRR